MNPEQYTVKWFDKISLIDKSKWDSLAVPLESPVLEWDWLCLLEESESIVPERGWHPNHLTVWKGETLAAAAPLYIKTHSEGEFIFDYLWADLADKLKIQYYPKMVGISPVTPVDGYRFLIHPEENKEEITTLMVEEIDRFCLKNKIVSCNFLFIQEDWKSLILPYGFHAWKHQQYIWRNREYKDFSEYLAMFKKNQRRNIRRERKAMENSNISFKAFTDKEIPESFFALMYDYYSNTNAQFGIWAAKYLTKGFFLGLNKRYKHRLLFICAFKGELEKPIALSLLIIKGESIYGRYWGADKRYKHLHFNACYYEPIDWAIKRGILRFNPGIGGYHKARRGFEAVTGYSLHKFYDMRLQFILDLNIDRINQFEQEGIDELNMNLPFKKIQK
jgi:predicted N-acyltransferase